MRKMSKFVWASGGVLGLLAACSSSSKGGFPGIGDDAAAANDGSSSSGSSSGSSGGSSSGSSSGSSGAHDAGPSGDGGAPTCAKLAACCPAIMGFNAQLGMACTQTAAGNSESACQSAYATAKAQDPLCM